MRCQHGVAIGIVREREDEDGQGRLKLEYPWLPGSPLSPWASIAVPLAGGSRGAWLMPEIGDEVLVAFEHGDFQVPYIVGFLWNGVDRPPETDPKLRLIHTPGDNELCFDDNDDKQQVTLRTKAGQRLELIDDGKKVVLRTNGGLSVTLDEDGSSIELSGGGRKITMSDSKVKIT